MSTRAVFGRLAALLARTESPFEEEARTSALLAVQLMKRHGILPANLAAMVKRLEAAAAKTGARITAQHFASRGGRKGGPARAAALTPERRRDIAQKAALARWDKRAQLGK